MELPNRLAALAAYVPAGSAVADIGTDHAYLPVYLVVEGICRKVIATDVNPGPFRSAERKIAEYNLKDKIELRLGDGLQALKPGEADVLVIAGMGGNTIREILSASPRVLKGVYRLILQPMADPGDLRYWLVSNGWKLIDEQLVEEEGRLYVIIVAAPGREETRDAFLLEMGPRLLEKKDPLLPFYFDRLLETYQRVLNGLSCAKSEEARWKAREIENKMSRIREVARCR